VAGGAYQTKKEKIWSGHDSQAEGKYYGNQRGISQKRNNTLAIPGKGKTKRVWGGRTFPSTTKIQKCQLFQNSEPLWGKEGGPKAVGGGKLYTCLGGEAVRQKKEKQ